MDGFYDYWAGYDKASRDIDRFGSDEAFLLLMTGSCSDRSDDWTLGYGERLFEEKRGGGA